MSHTRKKRLGAALAAAGLTLQLTSCGTILHPERRGQPPGRLDPAIVVLDAVGLLLFFVPGVIAFAVDFTTGTIYLPPEHATLIEAAPGELRTVRLSPQELTPEQISDVVARETGKRVRLQPGAYRATPLGSPADLSGGAWNRAEAAGQGSYVRFPGRPDEPPARE